MATIRALVLAQLERGPKTMNELLEAIDEIETPKQLSNCLHNLRSTGAVTRDDDRRYHIAPADDAAPASNPIVDAITRMPAPSQKQTGEVSADHRAIAAAMGVDPIRVANDFAALVDNASALAEARTLREEARAHLDLVAEFKKQIHDTHGLEAVERIRERINRTAGPQSPVRAILERSVEANQAALDDYLTSVADPRILGPLRNARDEARAALAALDNSGGAA